MAASRGGRDRSPAQSRQGHCRSVEGFVARPIKNKFRSLFADVRFWPLADIPHVAFDVAFGGKADSTISGNSLSRSLSGVKRTWPCATQIETPLNGHPGT